MPDDWTPFLFGALGGVVGEVSKWFPTQESPNLPAYLRSFF
jgi:hypothetical protein